MRSPIRCSTTCCGTRRAAMPSAERGRVQVASASAPAQSAAPMRPQANRRPHRITSCFEPDGLRAATKRFNGNYLNEETVLAVTRAAEYGMAAAGKLGPAAHVRCQRYQRYPCSSSTIRPVAKMPPAQRGGRCPTQLLLNCDCRSERTSRPPIDSFVASIALARERNSCERSKRLRPIRRSRATAKRCKNRGVDLARGFAFGAFRWAGFAFPRRRSFGAGPGGGRCGR